MLSSLYRFTSAVILGTMFGQEITKFEKDRFAKRMFHSAARFAGSLAPGAFMVDIIPWLNNIPLWFPGMKWKREGLKWAEEDRVLYTDLLEAAKVCRRNFHLFT